MKFIRTDREQAIVDLSSRLRNELVLGKKVLWLISGGSNTDLSREILKDIPEEYSERLTIMLNDERYGTVGHKDSNWHKFVSPADFPHTRARLEPTLRPKLSFEETINYYERLTQQAFNSNNAVISMLGMGADGHTAGILPNSPAAHVTDQLVTGYKGPDFRRLTLTFEALRKVSAAYLLAFGDEKHRALNNLQARALSLEDQPAQILWEIPEAYVYNDQIGETA